MKNENHLYPSNEKLSFKILKNRKYLIFSYYIFNSHNLYFIVVGIINPKIRHLHL